MGETEGVTESRCPKCATLIRPYVKLRRGMKGHVHFDLYFRCGCSEILAADSWANTEFMDANFPEAWTIHG